MSAAPAVLERRPGEQQAAENLARLDGCQRPHLFALVQAGGGKGLRAERWRCVLCGGRVTGRDRGWYEAGLSDGRREASRP